MTINVWLFLCIIYSCFYVYSYKAKDIKEASFEYPITVHSHNTYLREKLQLPVSRDLKIYGYADSLEKSQSYLLSAKKFNIPVTDLFFSDYPVHVWIRKFYTLRHVIHNLPNDTLIIFSDVFDVLFVNNTDFFIKKFKSLNCDLLISGEIWYSHQPSQFKRFYDNMFKNTDTKYVNSGFIMGYCWIFKIMLDLSIQWYEANRYRDTVMQTYCDQTMVGIFFHEYHKKYRLKIDTDQTIAWTLTAHHNDWDKYYKSVYKRGKLFYKGVKELGIIHMPDKSNWGIVGTFIFNDIQAKSYL